jgi:hypothetical protein
MPPRQIGDIRRNPACPVFREQLRRRLSPLLVLEIDKSVVNDKVGGLLVDVPAGRHGSPPPTQKDRRWQE